MSVRRDRSGGDALRVALEGLDGVKGKTGYFETAKYKDGTPVAYVATIQEYGYPAGGIPARPTMRPTAADKGKPGGEWAQIAAAGAREVLRSKRSAPDALERLVMVAAADVAISITRLVAPPLSPKTIAARYRGRKDKPSKTGSKPLVATGQMLREVSGVVESKGGGRLSQRRWEE